MTIITTIAIMLAIAVLVTLFAAAIYRKSGDAMDRMMEAESSKRWKQVKGLDGTNYWMPEDNQIRTQSTVNR